MDDQYSFDIMNLDFLDATTTNVKPNVSGTGVQQHGQLQSTFDIESIASRIASVNDLAIQLKDKQEEHVKLQKQLQDLSDSAMSIQNMYEREKTEKSRYLIACDEYKAKCELAESQLANKTLHFEQLMSQMEQQKHRENLPISYNELALRYQRLALVLEEDKQLNSKERIVLQPIQEYIEAKKLTALSVYKKKSARIDTKQLLPKKQMCNQETQYERYTTTRATNTPATTPQKEMKTQGTQYISSMTTRGTSTSAFIKTQSIGTNFPEVVPVSIDDILNEMIYNVSPLSPMLANPPTIDEEEPSCAVKIETKSVGTNTGMQNVRKPIDYVSRNIKVELKSVATSTGLKNVQKPIDYVTANIKHSDSRPPSRNMFDRGMNDSPFMGMPTANPFNGFGINPHPMQNIVAELWNLLGQTLFTFLQNGNGQLNPIHANLVSDQLRDISANLNRHTYHPRTCDERSSTDNNYFEQKRDYLPATRSTATSPISPLEIGNKESYIFDGSYLNSVPSSSAFVPLNRPRDKSPPRDIQKIVLNKSPRLTAPTVVKKSSRVDEILKLFPENTHSLQNRNSIKRLLKMSKMERRNRKTNMVADLIDERCSPIRDKVLISSNCTKDDLFGTSSDESIPGDDFVPSNELVSSDDSIPGSSINQTKGLYTRLQSPVSLQQKLNNVSKDQGFLRCNDEKDSVFCKPSLPPKRSLQQVVSNPFHMRDEYVQQNYQNCRFSQQKPPNAKRKRRRSKSDGGQLNKAVKVEATMETVSLQNNRIFENAHTQEKSLKCLSNVNKEEDHRPKIVDEWNPTNPIIDERMQKCGTPVNSIRRVSSNLNNTPWNFLTPVIQQSEGISDCMKLGSTRENNDCNVKLKSPAYISASNSLLPVLTPSPEEEYVFQTINLGVSSVPGHAMLHNATTCEVTKSMAAPSTPVKSTSSDSDETSNSMFNHQKVSNSNRFEAENGLILYDSEVQTRTPTSDSEQEEFNKPPEDPLQTPGKPDKNNVSSEGTPERDQISQWDGESDKKEAKPVLHEEKEVNPLMSSQHDKNEMMPSDSPSIGEDVLDFRKLSDFREAKSPLLTHNILCTPNELEVKGLVESATLKEIIKEPSNSTNALVKSIDQTIFGCESDLSTDHSLSETASSHSRDSKSDLSMDCTPPDLSLLLKTPEKPTSTLQFKTPESITRNTTLLNKVLTSSTENLVEDFLLNEGPDTDKPKFQSFLDKIMHEVAGPLSPISVLAPSEKPITSETESSCDEEGVKPNHKGKKKLPATAAIAVKRSARLKAKTCVRTDTERVLPLLNIPIQLGKYTKKRAETSRPLKKFKVDNPEDIITEKAEGTTDIIWNIRMGFFKDQLEDDNKHDSSEEVLVIDEALEEKSAISRMELTPDERLQNKSDTPLFVGQILEKTTEGSWLPKAYDVHTTIPQHEPISFDDCPASPSPTDQMPDPEHITRQCAELAPMSNLPLISHIIANYNQKHHKMLTASHKSDKNLFIQLQTALSNFLSGQCLMMDSIRTVDTLLNITTCEKHIAEAIIFIVKAATRPELEMSTTVPDLYLSETLTKLLSILQQLYQRLPTLQKHLQATIEHSLFKYTKDITPLEVIMNLTQFYLAIIADPSQTTNSARLFICKCLYFYNQKAIPMIYETLCVYPTVLPKRDDHTYDRSDALISAIQCILMSTFYDLQKPDLKTRKMLTKLLKFYNYENYKPPRDELLDNLVAKIRADRFKNVPYAIAIICKRMEQAKAEKVVLLDRLLPLANEYYQTLSQTTENDGKVACVLECISFIIKPFAVETDISTYTNLFGRFLNVSERQIIQEAALAALLRTIRFGYVNCFNAIYNFKPSYELTEETKAMLRSFVYKKNLEFLKRLEHQAHLLVAT